jgi:hypothetical protein
VPLAQELEQNTGEVAEWSNVPDSKSGVGCPPTVGSNPTLSAKIMSSALYGHQKTADSTGSAVFYFISFIPSFSQRFEGVQESGAKDGAECASNCVGVFRGRHTPVAQCGPKNRKPAYAGGKSAGRQV